MHSAIGSSVPGSDQPGFTKHPKEKSRFKYFDPIKISTFSSIKAGQPVTVEIYSNPAFHYLDLTFAQRGFFHQVEKKVVISMLQNSGYLDMSFEHSSHSPCNRDFNASVQQ